MTAGEETVPRLLGDGILEYVPRLQSEIQAYDDVSVAVEACGIYGTDLNTIVLSPAGLHNLFDIIIAFYIA